jgi:hypothetical protein
MAPLLSLLVTVLLLLSTPPCLAAGPKACSRGEISTLGSNFVLTATTSTVYAALTFTTAVQQSGTKVTLAGSAGNYVGLSVDGNQLSADWKATFANITVSGSGCNTGAPYGAAYAVLRMDNTPSNWFVGPKSIRTGTGPLTINWLNLNPSGTTFVTYHLQLYVYTPINGGTCTLTIPATSAINYYAASPSGC